MEGLRQPPTHPEETEEELTEQDVGESCRAIFTLDGGTESEETQEEEEGAEDDEDDSEEGPTNGAENAFKRVGIFFKILWCVGQDVMKANNLILSEDSSGTLP